MKSKDVRMDITAEHACMNAETRKIIPSVLSTQAKSQKHRRADRVNAEEIEDFNKKTDR